MKIVERVQPVQIARGHLSDSLLKNGIIAGMRHEITATKHVNPRLAVADDFGGERLFDETAWRDQIQDNAVEFQIIPQRFPREFKWEFESLDRPFPFQFREARDIGQPLAKKRQGILVILKPLFPSNIGIHLAVARQARILVQNGSTLKFSSRSHIQTPATRATVSEPNLTINDR